MSDAATRARELLDKATPGPWEAATCHESEQETRSEYVRNSLLEPDAPAHGLWMAWKPDSRLGVHLTAVTGDGPHGEADAELIAAAPTLLAELANEVETAWRAYHAVADEVEVLRQRRIVSEGMVRRASKAYDDAVVDGPWTRQDLIRAALEAALGVES